MPSRNILAFAGSGRDGSFNRRLVAVAAAAAEAAGATVKIVNLRDYGMPLYDGDMEAKHGVPEGALEFRRDLAAHDGLLISCPEYNGGITALLKNSIDWASRPVDGEGSVFQGKSAALVAASPGALGGLRGLPIVRQILNNLGVHVIPQQVAVGKAAGVLTADGGITDEGIAKRVTGVATALVEFVAKHGQE